MPIPPILWCTSHRPSSPPPTSQPIPRLADDTAPAAVKLTTDIWKKAQLTVAFQEKQLLGKWGIDELIILEWANRWKQEQDDSLVPSFVHHGDKSVEKPDIIVELNDSKKNESKIGCSKPEEQPRMWLDLSKDGDYREHVVVHEFGHTLGLEHEHQRSDFWEKVGPCLNDDKMKEDIKTAGGKYKDYKSKGTTQSQKSVYDPDSVMHYWFKKEWLKEKYNSEVKIQKERRELAISYSEMEALLGIIRRDSSHPFVTTPSDKDRMLLKEVYGGSKQQTPSVEEMVEPADLDLEVFKKDQIDNQKAREIHTKMEVQYENLYQRLRKKLVNQKDVLRGIQDSINFSVQRSPQFKKALGNLTSPTTVEGFFKNLLKHAHYLDFNGILDHLIRKHGDDELKEDAKLYRCEFLDLLGRVTVKQAIKEVLFPIDDEDEIPKNFSKVKQHILKDPDRDRLIDIIKYRRRFTSRVQLHHLLSCVMGIEELASYVLIWLIPTDIVDLLVDEIKKVDIHFFQENMVTLISVNDEVVYPDPYFKSSIEVASQTPGISSTVQQEVPQIEAITDELSSSSIHVEEAIVPFITSSPEEDEDELVAITTESDNIDVTSESMDLL